MDQEFGRRSEDNVCISDNGRSCEVDLHTNRDGEAMGYQLRKATKRQWNKPKRKKCVAVNKAERVRNQIQRCSLEFCQLVFGIALVKIFYYDTLE